MFYIINKYMWFIKLLKSFKYRTFKIKLEDELYLPCEINSARPVWNGEIIKVKGYIKIKLKFRQIEHSFCLNDFNMTLLPKLANSIKNIVLSNICSIVLNNYKDKKTTKLLIIKNLNNYRSNGLIGSMYYVESFIIDEVYDVKSKERKNKLKKLNELARKNNK